jgi:hypothetical protein
MLSQMPLNDFRIVYCILIVIWMSSIRFFILLTINGAKQKLINRNILISHTAVEI